jgi:hypothetical protein
VALCFCQDLSRLVLWGNARRAVRDARARGNGRLPIKRVVYRGPSLRHCRHTSVRNMSDAGLEERRIMDISGHVTRSMFDRYNIGKEKDIEEARRAIEQFHKKVQRKRK